MSEIKDVEVIPKESEELLGGKAGVLQVSKEGIEDMIYLSEKVDQLVNAYNKFKVAVCKLAQPGDWVVFGDNSRSKAEMTSAAAERIGTAFGVTYSDRTEPKKTSGTDKLGDWFLYECECTVSYGKRSVRTWGRSGSRDKFFGKVHGSWKDLSEVKDDDVKAAAIHRAMSEGVKVLFGLRRLDPKYLEKNGVILDYATNVAFKTKDQKAEEVKSLTVKIKEVRKKEGDKTKGQTWTLYTINCEKGEVFRTFSESLATSANSLIGETVTVNYHVDEKYGSTIDSIAEGEGGI